MNKSDAITYIPYQQENEPARKAAFTQVHVDLSGFTDNELQVIGHLVEAANRMNPIYCDQFDGRTAVLRRLLERLLPFANKDQREKLANYKAILNLQNGPFSSLPRKNHLLDIPADELRELAEKAGAEAETELSDTIDLLTSGQDLPAVANFYPQGFSDEDFASLGDDANVVNSSVVKADDGSFDVVLNEKRYQQSLQPVLHHLRAARDLAEDPGLKVYLDAKILEIETGAEEARRLADYTWVKHRSPLDIVISTALEVYMDDFKNARGAATGGVYVRNRAAEELLASIVERVPHFEQTAPWTFKNDAVDPSRLPTLKFVDVLAWAGDYVSSPNTTIAQSLPNDQWVVKNVGAVNMVFLNTGKAAHSMSGKLYAREFLAREEFEDKEAILFDSSQLHSALHEIGHSTGAMDPDHRSGQPSDYLKEEYAALEEARAELFGLWALKPLVEDGVISTHQAEACYASMLITMLSALRFEPVQAHTKARNAIFHYFDEHGLIERVEEDGHTHFAIRHENAHAVVADMLKTVADLRSTGDYKGTVTWREKYIFTDPMKSDLEERTIAFPLGRGLIFPSIRKEGDRYLPEAIYPESFSQQEKFFHTLEG